jgi:GrpB-like predicted nucleotidyltransferase (UPF0157 family)
VIVPHRDEWSDAFEAERLVLEQVLAPWLQGGIHHVGSTAVVGLAAKPILDMIAGVSDLDTAREAFEPLGRASYVYSPHRPGIAHHFVKRSLQVGEVTHSLHLTEPDSDLWRERLAFRDLLRADRSLRDEYADLKLKLAREHRDVDAYTAGKREFVARVLALVGLRPGRR